MAHKDWCGNSCAECNNPCALDESIPCSPDCENLLPDGTRKEAKCLEAKCDAFLIDTKNFVKRCGELLNTAKPHLISCEYRLGKDMPKNNSKNYLDDDEYVLITCVNGYTYEILITGNSLIATAEAIFSNMAFK